MPCRCSPPSMMLSSRVAEFPLHPDDELPLEPATAQDGRVPPVVVGDQHQPGGPRVEPTHRFESRPPAGEPGHDRVEAGAGGRRPADLWNAKYRRGASTSGRPSRGMRLVASTASAGSTTGMTVDGDPPRAHHVLGVRARTVAGLGHHARQILRDDSVATVPSGPEVVLAALAAVGRWRLGAHGRSCRRAADRPISAAARTGDASVPCSFNGRATSRNGSGGRRVEPGEVLQIDHAGGREDVVARRAGRGRRCSGRRSPRP